MFLEQRFAPQVQHQWVRVAMAAAAAVLVQQRFASRVQRQWVRLAMAAAAAARSLGVVGMLADVAARMLVVRTLAVVRSRKLAVVIRTPIVGSCAPSAGDPCTTSDVVPQA